MEKEKILNLAQKNHAVGNEFENRVASKGTTLSCLTSIIIGIILFLIEYVAKGSANIGLLAIGLTASCVQSLYEGIRNKKHCSLSDVASRYPSCFYLLSHLYFR